MSSLIKVEAWIDKLVAYRSTYADMQFGNFGNIYVNFEF